MKQLVYMILAMLIVSCVGGSTGDGGGRMLAKDSDTIVTVVNPIDTSTMNDTTLLALSMRQVDSIVFRLTHHYTNNFNFLVNADSLTLIPRDGDLIQDTCRVYHGDLIAVAEIKIVPTDSIDSIWVKVAHDQFTMGWIPEDELLSGVTPDDLISQLIYALSSSRTVWMSAMVVAGLIALFIRNRRIRNLKLLRFSQMASPYPFLFLALVALLASLYASVQNFLPEFWQEYYYHPTLNPLVLPPIMAALVVTVWLVIIVFVAVIDEVYHHFYAVEGIAYLLELISIAMVIYLIINWTTAIYIGYPLALVLLGFLAYASVKAVRS